MIDSSYEVPIGTVDCWQLSGTVRWPIMRAIARGFVEQVALHHYMQNLLETQNWSVVRVSPHLDSRHVYDVFGVPR